MKVILAGLLLIIVLLIGAVYFQFSLVGKQKAEIVQLTGELENFKVSTVSNKSGSGKKRYNDYSDSIPRQVPVYGKYVVSQRFSDIHKGIDLAAVTGTKIVPSAVGVVVDKGYDEIYGNYLVIDHLNGYKTKYAHASKVFVKLKEYVYIDDVIALVGNTGKSTDPHLHFEIIESGEKIDPAILIKFDKQNR